MAADLQIEIHGAINDQTLRSEATVSLDHAFAATDWSALPELKKCLGHDSTTALREQT